MADPTEIPPGRRRSAADAPGRYSIAGGRPQLESAFRLVYRNYLDKGLITENPHGMRVTPYHLVPTTSVFVATVESEIVCTVTLIGDGELGVPMDATNPEIVGRLRAQGKSFGEVSCLAFEHLGVGAFLPVFIKLTRLMAQHARAFGMDYFLMATIPQHARFYKRFMGFQQVGKEQPYPTVCDTRGVACWLDFARIDRCRPACYEQYFGVPIPAAELQPRPLSVSDAAFFRPAAEWASEALAAPL